MTYKKFSPKILNIMDSSLMDLKTKGVLNTVARIYNPNDAFSKVYHFTPHEKDAGLSLEFSKHNIEIIPHAAGGLSPLKIIKTTFQMWRLINSEKIDLVRGRLPYLGSLMGAIAAKLAGIPFVVSLGGDNRIVQERNGIYNYNSKFFSYGIEWLTLKLASSIIVPNDYTHKYVTQLIGTKSSIRKSKTIPWISDPVSKIREEVGDKRLAGLDSNKKLIIIIGFLNRYKYTDVLFETIENIIDGDDLRKKPTNFVFCGDGPLREDGEDRFKDYPGSIWFFGWTEKNIVLELMRRANIVLVPMSGFVLLEAASLGKAVITSNVEWHSEIVKNEETGLLVSPEDPDAWEQAIIKLLKDQNRAEELGAKLEMLYHEEYTSTKTIEAELMLYTGLIGKTYS